MAAHVTEKNAFPLPESGAASSPAPALQGDLIEISAYSDFKALLGDAGHLVFQGAHWLQAWFATMNGPSIRACYWLTFRDAAGVALMGLPLVLRQEGRLRVIGMPDGGASDYLGPVFHRAAATSHALQPKAVWACLKSLLPPADLLRFEGLKAEIGGFSNPLVSHPLATSSRLSGWKVDLPEHWEAYFAGLPPRMRENLGKARRRFLRHAGARIALASDAAEALEWLEHLDRMQSQRLAERGVETQIVSASFSKLYRKLAETGIGTGDVVMIGLFAEDQVVALNYAVRTGDRATYLRVANLFGPWSPMSPGLLVTEQIIQHMHRNGVKVFDFGMGEYDYKKRFGGQPFPLTDIALPLSARGMPAAASFYLRRRLRDVEIFRKLTGRKSLNVDRS